MGVLATPQHLEDFAKFSESLQSDMKKHYPEVYFRPVCFRNYADQVEFHFLMYFAQLSKLFSGQC